MADIDITVQDASIPETKVVTISGNINAVTTADVERSVLELINASVRFIVADVSKVTCISSRGWSLFLTSSRALRERKGDIVLVGMPAEVHDVFEMMELYLMLKNFDSVEAACTYITEKGDEPQSAPSMNPQEYAFDELKEKIYSIISQNPHYTAKEIRTALNTEEYGNVRIGFLRLKGYLQDLALDTTEKRQVLAKKLSSQ